MSPTFLASVEPTMIRSPSSSGEVGNGLGGFLASGFERCGTTSATIYRGPRRSEARQPPAAKRAANITSTRPASRHGSQIFREKATKGKTSHVDATPRFPQSMHRSDEGCCLHADSLDVNRSHQAAKALCGRTSEGERGPSSSQG